ncbi:interferon regulatory factor 3 [Osmerus eperlanus]|uniref:interferon regulatory factor 3 n=1 Tax=Osmerus eperlanus TaxID=29151 RepID=UPI002E0E11E1
MSQSKPLLIPWLRKQIDSGQYPGVGWTNQERTEFCIPWKHALRQDSSSADVLIFKAWAEASSGKAQGDASIWKRNFRAALRAKGFQNICDNKNDAANPHRVFRWPGDAPAGGSQEPAEADLYQEPPLDGGPEGPRVYAVYLPQETFTGGDSPNEEPDLLERCLNGLNIVEPPEDGQNDQIFEEFPGQQPYPETMGAEGGVGLPGQPAYPMGEVVGLASEEAMVTQLVSSMSSTMEDHFKTQFKVSVYFRGQKVSEQLVENDAGFRLVYRPELTRPVRDPLSGLHLVSLPTVGPMVDHNQARLTQTILENMGDGLEVGVTGSVIYGWRRGESRVFWSLCKFDHSRTPQEVSKREPQQLYLAKDFFWGLHQFIIHGGGDSPPISVFLCLGEKWPDPDTRPWEKKLVTVEVVFTSLEMLKEMAVRGGASSLQSVELQLSLQESLQELMELC